MTNDRELWIYKGGTAPAWKRRGLSDLPPYDPGAGGQTDPGTGGGTTPTTPTTAVTPELPWELTAAMRKQMSASSRKAFGHYFYTFPLAVNNTEDWYTNRWLPEAPNKPAADVLTGGQLRDRPLPIPAKNRTGDWAAEDKATEVRQAIAAGFDGFMPDFLQVAGTGAVPNQRWTQHLELMRGINLVGDPNFKLVPMVDSYTSGSADPNILAEHMRITFNDPSSFRLPTGEAVLAAYAPERAPQNAPNNPAVNYWPVVLGNLRTTHKTLFLACFLDAWTGSTTAQSFDEIAWMFSRWGDRDPTASAANSTSNRLAPTTSHGGTWAGTGLLAQPGKLWMHPVSVQDSRPNQSAFWEAWGWDNLVATWKAAIDGNADWVQVPTWSDFAEHANIGVTRNQTVRGSTPVKDDVCVAVFLTAPATVNVTVGGTTSTPTTANPAPAGFSVHKVPLRVGAVSAEAVRSGVTVAAAVSPFKVSATQITDDYNYRAVSSLRKAA
jgi:hypothetical protein